MNRKAMANLSLEILIRECSNTQRPNDDLFYDFSYANRENIHAIFKYRKFNYDFTDTLTCYNDGEHIIGYIGPSYDDFLYNVLRFLGLEHKNKVEDNEELTKKMLERVKRLSEIKTELELQKEFPVLFDDLIQGRRFIQGVERMSRRTEEEKQRYETQRHYYYACALKQRLDRFIATQCDLYKRFILQREEYKELINQKSYNKYIQKNFDLNKIAMYTVHRYVMICEQTDDKEVIKKYFPLIEKYKDSSYEKNCSLIAEAGIKVDWESLQRRIQNIEKKLGPKEALAEWELVPEGRDYSRVQIDSQSKPRELTMDEEALNQLRSIGEDKKTFYESTPYMVKVMGLSKYRGYIGYIYPNGEVLLDREYNEDAPSTAKGNAIYHIHAIDFEALSRLDKGVLRKHPKVGRIIHRNNWQDKAKEIIYQEGEETSKEEAKQLVKKLMKEEQ